MALTKLEALEKFCTRMDYAARKLPDETKLQFLARMRKEWSMSVVMEQVRIDKEAEAYAAAATETVADDF